MRLDRNNCDVAEACGNDATENVHRNQTDTLANEIFVCVTFFLARQYIFYQLTMLQEEKSSKETSRLSVL